MISYFILGVCLLGALLLAGKYLLTTDPKNIAKTLRYTGFGICAAMAAFLLLTGRFALGLPLAFAAVAFLRRWALPHLGPRMGGPKQSAGYSSNVETAYLRMTLDHDSGAMQGEVLQGNFAGREISDLTQDDLLALLAECQRDDPESAQLLEGFLDRSQGGDWRQAAGGYDHARTSHGNMGNMSLDEAREVLGLDINPSPSEIREAHKRLMLKNHPDKGGSSYLAAKINQAKDLLLGQ